MVDEKKLSSITFRLSETSRHKLNEFRMEMFPELSEAELIRVCIRHFLDDVDTYGINVMFANKMLKCK